MPRQTGHRRALLAALLSVFATPAFPRPPGQTTIARVDHIALHVADVDASARFYTEYFGLRELPVPIRGPRWLDLGGGVALHLIGGRATPVANDRSVHLAISLRDYDGLVARLTAAGRDFFSFDGRRGVSESGRGDGVRQLFLRDPDGYWIEINDIFGRAGR